MVIDFHTHIYPKEVAPIVIRQAEAKIPPVGCPPLRAKTNGTLEGLKSSMKECGIDYSVVLPVATKPSQFAAINKYAAEITGKEGIISFGGMHPAALDYKSELEQIKALGLKGIKIHPDYQETFVDDPKIIRMVDYAAKLDLIVVLHTGKASGYSIIHCSPRRIRNLLNAADSSRLIVAHSGGYHCWDEAEEYIIGGDFMIDMSTSIGRMEDAQFKRIIRKQGIDKVVFATDSPWADQKGALEDIRKLDFTEDELDKILYRNAAKLLKLI